MSIKDLAVKAAAAKATFDREQAQIAAEQKRMDNERNARQYAFATLGVMPDEVISSSKVHENYVRFEDMWFAVGPRGYWMSPRPLEGYDKLALIPQVRCQDDPTEFHSIDASLFGGGIIGSLEALGAFLQRLPAEKWQEHLSYMHKCSCNQERPR